MYINSKFSSEQKKANITFNVHRGILYSKVKQIVGIFSYFERFLGFLCGAIIPIIFLSHQTLERCALLLIQMESCGA